MYKTPFQIGTYTNIAYFNKQGINAFAIIHSKGVLTFKTKVDTNLF